MKKKAEKKNASEVGREKAAVSRRAFLTRSGSVGAAVAVAASGLMGSRALAESEDAKQAQGNDAAKQSASEGRVTKELPIPETNDKPKQTNYTADVLVIGGGFAGLNAAVAARKEGCSVIVVDKGKPGYSGLSPFPSSHRWFDPEFGDHADAFRKSIQKGSEYIANMDWYELWIKESKAAYERLKEWQILVQYPKASQAGEYDKNGDYVGYREKFDDLDRRAKFTKVLKDNGIDYVVRTMIVDVIEQNGAVVGAIGFDVPSGTIMTFHAKAVVMCTGSGSYKPSGFPTATDTFDGVFIGYQHGLPIVGKEFDDFHGSISYAAGNAFLGNSWEYLENIWLCGGDVTPENVDVNAVTKARGLVLSRVMKAVHGLPNNDGKAFADVTKSTTGRRGNSLSGRPDDPRTGKANSPTPVEDIDGGAVGMCLHLGSGIFCGVDDLVGRTALPGLYVAGDGTNGSAVTGAAYPHGVGFTSSFCSLQGWRAGQAAGKYAAHAVQASIPAETIAQMSREILAPMERSHGLDANWARDVLQATMAPYWIHITKSEATLRSALTQIEYMRDSVLPQLMAPTSHDLRLCHEMRHKVLSAEMKLRASLERKESRGIHYRTDYPYRDDKNYLCYIALTKGGHGEMQVSKIDIKDEWKGNVNQDYASRYAWRFPGEAKAKGLPEESKEPHRG